MLFDGTIPSDNFLFDGTVPSNNFYLHISQSWLWTLLAFCFATSSFSIHEEHEPERTELNPSIRILESKKRSYDILNPRANKRQRLSQNEEVPDGSPEAEKVPEGHLVKMVWGRPMVMEDYQLNILAELSTWQMWAEQVCLRAGKLEHLRRHLEFDKRVINCFHQKLNK